MGGEEARKANDFPQPEEEYHPQARVRKRPSFVSKSCVLECHPLSTTYEMCLMCAIAIVAKPKASLPVVTCVRRERIRQICFISKGKLDPGYWAWWWWGGSWGEQFFQRCKVCFFLTCELVFPQRFTSHINTCWLAGTLAAVDDYTLEQLAYILSGLSPLTHVRDLMVSNRGQLKLGRASGCERAAGVQGLWQTLCHNEHCVSQCNVLWQNTWYQS